MKGRLVPMTLAARKHNLTCALAHFADYFAVGVQFALAAAFGALIAKQLPSVIARSTWNLLIPCLETSAAASGAFDHIWPE